MTSFLANNPIHDHKALFLHRKCCPTMSFEGLPRNFEASHFHSLQRSTIHVHHIIHTPCLGSLASLQSEGKAYWPLKEV